MTATAPDPPSLGRLRRVLAGTHLSLACACVLQPGRCEQSVVHSVSLRPRDRRRARGRTRQLRRTGLDHRQGNSRDKAQRCDRRRTGRRGRLPDTDNRFKATRPRPAAPDSACRLSTPSPSSTTAGSSVRKRTDSSRLSRSTFQTTDNGPSESFIVRYRTDVRSLLSTSPVRREAPHKRVLVRCHRYLNTSVSNQISYAGHGVFQDLATAGMINHFIWQVWIPAGTACCIPEDVDSEVGRSNRIWARPLNGKPVQVLG